MMMRRRGVVGMVARTAVVAGTATVVSKGVSGAMDNKSQQKAAAQQSQQEQAAAAQQAQIDAAVQQQLAAQQAAAPAAPPPAAAPMSMDEKIAQIQKLGELKAQGILTQEEFDAQKAKILGS